MEENKKKLVNCLQNKKVIIRHIPKNSTLVSNPKHALYGGMSETTKRVFVVPRLSNGTFVNILTNDEKNYLEHILNLEENALSVHKKNENFWDDSNESGISQVVLMKRDNYLDLSNPQDYIRYKILLANKDYIAPSIEAQTLTPKATYQFVIIEEDDTNKQSKLKMTTTMKCYKEFGKIENNIDILKLVVETLEGKPVAKNSKLDFLQTRINDFIQADPKLFLKIVEDETLETKCFIRKCIEKGLIQKKGTFLYNALDKTPLCNAGEDPTLNVAVAYINAPENQELKFALQARLKE